MDLGQSEQLNNVDQEGFEFFGEERDRDTEPRDVFLRNLLFRIGLDATFCQNLTQDKLASDPMVRETMDQGIALFLERVKLRSELHRAIIERMQQRDAARRQELPPLTKVNTGCSHG